MLAFHWYNPGNYHVTFIVSPCHYHVYCICQDLDIVETIYNIMNWYWHKLGCILGIKLTIHWHYVLHLIPCWLYKIEIKHILNQSWHNVGLLLVKSAIYIYKICEHLVKFAYFVLHYWFNLRLTCIQICWPSMITILHKVSTPIHDANLLSIWC